MFDKLKLLCVITMAYAQMGIENAYSSIHHYFYPVVIQQSIVEDGNIDQGSVLPLEESQAEDLQEAINFLLQDGNPSGQQIIKVLENSGVSKKLQRITLSRAQLEETLYLMPIVVKSYGAQRFVLLIVLSATEMSQDDANLLQALHDAIGSKEMKEHHIFYDFRRDRFVESF